MNEIAKVKVYSFLQQGAPRSFGLTVREKTGISIRLGIRDLLKEVA